MLTIVILLAYIRHFISSFLTPIKAELKEENQERQQECCTADGRDTGPVAECRLQKIRDPPRRSEIPIKIGFMGALTGDVAMFGKPTLEGMKMAADEINASDGVNGKKMEIIETDNRCNRPE